MISQREKILFRSVFTQTEANSKKQVFDILSSAFAELTGADEDDLNDAFMEQESQSPSGIGRGVALPHLQIEKLNEPICILMKLKRPVNFAAIDDEPVDIVCCLISPSADGPYHLRRLSRFSRLLRNETLCAAIRATDDPTELQDLFYDSQTQMLAAA